MDARASAGQRPEPVTISSSLHRSICVLFSGGIDCSLLAALLCKVLEEHGRSTTVELANVSFTDDVERLEREKGPELETLLPDRFTACRRVRRPFTSSDVVRRAAVSVPPPALRVLGGERDERGDDGEGGGDSRLRERRVCGGV